MHSHICVLSALTFCVTIKKMPDILENVIRLKLHFACAYPSAQQCLRSLCLVAAVWFIFHLVRLSKKITAKTKLRFSIYLWLQCCWSAGNLIAQDSSLDNLYCDSLYTVNWPYCFHSLHLLGVVQCEGIIFFTISKCHIFYEWIWNISFPFVITNTQSR